MLRLSVRLRFVLKQGLQEWLDASDICFYAVAGRGCIASCTAKDNIEHGIGCWTKHTTINMSHNVGWLEKQSCPGPLDVKQSSDSVYSRYRCALKYVSLSSFTAAKQGGVPHPLEYSMISEMRA